MGLFMRVGFSQCAMVSAGLAIICFFGLTFIPSTSSNAVSLSLALLVSGIVTPWLTSIIFTNSSEAAATNKGLESATLYVGNLPYKANEEAVKEYFKGHTEVQSVRLMKDRKTGKRKGYGFVEILTVDVNDAIDKLNNSIFLDRTLKVRPAKEKQEDNHES